MFKITHIHARAGMRALAAAACLAALAHAHVDLVSPEGGEKLTGGAAFTIAWDADDHNAVYNLYFSPDSGKSWSTISLGIARDVRTFKWTVPNQATKLGVVRILQDNATGTDPDARSAVFNIEATAGVAAAPEAEKASLGFRSGNVEVSLELPAAAEVSLQAFDARGALVATLLEERRAAGSHRLSLFSNRLQTLRPLLFKLRMGDAVRVFNTAGTD